MNAIKKMKIDSAPMGWNSWDCYGAGVTEEILLKNAEYMAKNLKAYGWEYIVCDIQWYEPKAKGGNYNNFTELCMDEYSRLIPAVNRFPSSADGVGFKAISDKIHAMGLKFGIHIMRGIPRQAVHQNTPTKLEGVTARDIAAQFSVCPWNTDMYGINPNKKGAQEYYNSLFEMYAEWGVDFIKCDDISCTEFKPHEPYSAKKEIELIRNAINNCGRDMVLSLSPGPAPINEHYHLNEHANMWRMSGDFWDNWKALYNMFDLCAKWAPYVQIGGYPDCDMLPLGRLAVDVEYQGGKARYTNFTKDEQVTMMNLWCIFRSPLMMGGEMCDNDKFTLSLLTNRNILKMQKESRNAKEALRTDDGEIIWTADAKGGKYIALFNTSEKRMTVEAQLNSLFEKECLSATELWGNKKASIENGVLKATLRPHASKVYFLTTD